MHTVHYDRLHRLICYIRIKNRVSIKKRKKKKKKISTNERSYLISTISCGPFSCLCCAWICAEIEAQYVVDLVPVFFRGVHSPSTWTKSMAYLFRSRFQRISMSATWQRQLWERSIYHLSRLICMISPSYLRLMYSPFYLLGFNVVVVLQDQKTFKNNPTSPLSNRNVTGTLSTQCPILNKILLRMSLPFTRCISRHRKLQMGLYVT